MGHLVKVLNRVRRNRGFEGDLTSFGQHTTMYRVLYSYFQRMVQDRALGCDEGLKRTRWASVVSRAGVESEDT